MLELMICQCSTVKTAVLIVLFVVSDERKFIDHSAIIHHLDDDIFSSNLSDHCALLWRSLLALSAAPWLVKVSKAYGRLVLVSGGTKLTFLRIIGPHRSTVTVRRCGLLLQTEYIAWSVRRSFGLPVTIVSPAKTAEPIEMSL